MLAMALPVTTPLHVINRLSFEKKLGGIFNPIPISESFKGFFWGKWNRDFFVGGEVGKIPLIVLFLLPFHLLMYAFLLAYVVIVVIAAIQNDNTLLLFAYETVGFHIVL